MTQTDTRCWGFFVTTLLPCLMAHATSKCQDLSELLSYYNFIHFILILKQCFIFSYPPSAKKVALAKGILHKEKGFPCLGDVDAGDWVCYIKPVLKDIFNLFRVEIILQATITF